MKEKKKNWITPVTCPAEAKMISNISQPLFNPLLLILGIYRRSKTEWPKSIWDSKGTTVLTIQGRESLDQISDSCAN